MSPITSNQFSIAGKLTPNWTNVLSHYCEAMWRRNRGKGKSTNFKGNNWTHTNSSLTLLPLSSIPLLAACFHTYPGISLWQGLLTPIPPHSYTTTPHSKYRVLTNDSQLFLVRISKPCLVPPLYIPGQLSLNYFSNALFSRWTRCMTTRRKPKVIKKQF